MSGESVKAELYLNGKLVGVIDVKGQNNSWHFGEFRPSDGFGEFAPIFGRWSLLMHADGETERLSDAASDELRQVEVALDQLRVKIRLVESGQWRHVRQINIDGGLVDWKE